MFSIAYHPQINSSSEVTNQIAEIALCHWLIILKQSNNWSMMLLHLQAVLNNSTKYSFTNLSSNQILFKFWTHEILNLLYINESDIIKVTADVINSVHSSKHIKLVIMNQYKSVYINTKDVIVFFTMHIKEYYDKAHQSCFFSIENIINLQLHCSYILPSLVDQNKKLKQQFVDLICITEQIDQLVYHFDLSSIWKIHNVISIIHLKSASTNNSYQCSQSKHLNAVIISPDTESEWELQQLIQKQMYCKDCEYITEYLTQWMKYELKFDIWINVKNLENVRELMNEFDRKNMTDKKIMLL